MKSDKKTETFDKPTLEVEEMKIISHSLGVYLLNSILSDKKKERILPRDFYRNYYSHSGFDTLYLMVKKGLLTQREVFSSSMFHCTDKAIDIFRSDFAKLVPYVPKKEQGLEYLKAKINAYCWHYQYKFGDNNAETIIYYFNKYWLEGYKVSHTTQGVIKKFEAELKKHATWLNE